jgi:GH24 family phage-related lysozyme (muramidase)
MNKLFDFIAKMYEKLMKIHDDKVKDEPTYQTPSITHPAVTQMEPVVYANINTTDVGIATSSTVSPSPIDISDAGVKFISNEEGLVTHLYNDEANHATIGYGHLVHMGPIDGTESEEYKKGITIERALQILKEDCTRFVRIVDYMIRVPLTSAQFDALVSLAFNIGTPAFSKSTLVKVINNKETEKIEEAWYRWNKITKNGVHVISLVLQYRRQREYKLFSTGKYK